MKLSKESSPTSTAPSSISSTVKTSILIAWIWRTRARVHHLPSNKMPLASLLSVSQQPNLHLARHPPLGSLHNLALVKLPRSVVEDQRLDSLHNQLKAPDLGKHQQWVVAVLLLSAKHLLQVRAVALARHLRWDRSLLSDSQHLAKHLNQRLAKHRSPHLVRLVLLVNNKPPPVLSVQRQHNQVGSRKLHNSHRRASDSLQPLAQRLANQVPSRQRQAVRLSNKRVLSRLHRTTLHNNRQARSAPHLNLLSVNLHNPQRSRTLLAQQQAARQSLPSARQHSPQATPLASPHSQPRHLTPLANRPLSNSHSSNNNKASLQQAKPPARPPAPTP
jgi:hypothetical protein